MAIKFLYKCNPLVAKAAGVTAFDRWTWPDGTFLLWENDMMAIDQDRYFLDREGFLADYGIVRMTDPQAAQEQRSPVIRLPEARLEAFRWEQPSASAESTGGAEAGTSVESPSPEAGRVEDHALLQSSDGAEGLGEAPPHEEEGGEG